MTDNIALPTSAVAIAFDYSAVEPTLAAILRKQTERIRSRLRKHTADIIETGRCVGEVDRSLVPLRQSLDPRIFLRQPLLHQRLVPFPGAMQRLLAGDAELRQKPRSRCQ